MFSQTTGWLHTNNLLITKKLNICIKGCNQILFCLIIFVIPQKLYLIQVFFYLTGYLSTFFRISWHIAFFSVFKYLCVQLTSKLVRPHTIHKTKQSNGLKYLSQIFTNLTYDQFTDPLD